MKVFLSSVEYLSLHCYPFSVARPGTLRAFPSAAARNLLTAPDGAAEFPSAVVKRGDSEASQPQQKATEKNSDKRTVSTFIIDQLQYHS